VDRLSLQKIDLHMHSTASDGSLSPSELLKKCKENNLKVVSITDHDTTAGLEEGRKTAEKLSIKFINGIEVTAKIPTEGKVKRELHILGYYIDPDSPSIKHLVEFSHASRVKRNRELVEKLAKFGISVSYEEFKKMWGENFGKPNVARYLVETGTFKDRESALDFLSSLGVHREKLDFREVIKLIREGGGIPVVAHPSTLRLNLEELYEFLKKAKNAGLLGVEIFHYRHTPSLVVALRQMAQDLELYTTGGSDFHSEEDKTVKLGFLNISSEDITFPL